MRDFYIDNDSFRVFLPVEFQDVLKGNEEAYNSRQIAGIMNTSRTDRQGEDVLAKGLDFSPFMSHGHFNDNHDPSTSAVVGYPEEVAYKSDLKTLDGDRTEGWLCRGYILKGTKRADGIWELAKALAQTPNRRLGFSIEGKAIRRKDKIIEKAIIKNVAVTNCPVNIDATWDVLAKSFYSEDVAIKSLTAGYATSPATQSGGGALRGESLESDKDKRPAKDKKDDKNYRALKVLRRSLRLPDEDELIKSLSYVFELRPDFTEEAAAELIHHLIVKEKDYDR